MNPGNPRGPGEAAFMELRKLDQTAKREDYYVPGKGWNLTSLHGDIGILRGFEEKAKSSKFGQFRRQEALIRNSFQGPNPFGMAPPPPPPPPQNDVFGLSALRLMQRPIPAPMRGPRFMRPPSGYNNRGFVPHMQFPPQQFNRPFPMNHGYPPQAVRSQQFPPPHMAKQQQLHRAFTPQLNNQQNHAPLQRLLNHRPQAIRPPHHQNQPPPPSGHPPNHQMPVKPQMHPSRRSRFGGIGLPNIDGQMKVRRPPKLKSPPPDHERINQGLSKNARQYLSYTDGIHVHPSLVKQGLKVEPKKKKKKLPEWLARAIAKKRSKEDESAATGNSIPITPKPGLRHRQQYSGYSILREARGQNKVILQGAEEEQEEGVEKVEKVKNRRMVRFTVPEGHIDSSEEWDEIMSRLEASIDEDETIRRIKMRELWAKRLIPFVTEILMEETEKGINEEARAAFLDSGRTLPSPSVSPTKEGKDSGLEEKKKQDADPKLDEEEAGANSPFYQDEPRSPASSPQIEDDIPLALPEKAPPDSKAAPAKPTVSVDSDSPSPTPGTHLVLFSPSAASGPLSKPLIGGYGSSSSDDGNGPTLPKATTRTAAGSHSQSKQEVEKTESSSAKKKVNLSGIREKALASLRKRARSPSFSRENSAARETSIEISGQELSSPIRRRSSSPHTHKKKKKKKRKEKKYSKRRRRRSRSSSSSSRSPRYKSRRKKKKRRRRS